MARVLLVQQEDEEGLHLMKLLREAGHAVEAAGTAFLARARFEIAGADVVIADLGSVGSKGASLVTELGFRAVKVIVIFPAEREGSEESNHLPWNSFLKGIRIERALPRPLDTGSLLAAVSHVAPSSC